MRATRTQSSTTPDWCSSPRCSGRGPRADTRISAETTSSGLSGLCSGAAGPRTGPLRAGQTTLPASKPSKFAPGRGGAARMTSSSLALSTHAYEPQPRPRRRRDWLRGQLRCLMCGRLVGRLLGLPRPGLRDPDASVSMLRFFAFRPADTRQPVVAYTPSMRFRCTTCGGPGALEEVQTFCTYEEPDDAFEDEPAPPRPQATTIQATCSESVRRRAGPDEPGLRQPLASSRTPRDGGDGRHVARTEVRPAPAVPPSACDGPRMCCVAACP